MVSLTERCASQFGQSDRVFPSFSFSPSLKMAQTGLVQFSGHQHLRIRLVLSLLSGKAVRIDKIRSDDKNPGLRGVCTSRLIRHKTQRCAADFEISLLRLLEKITNGTIIEISVTGMSYEQP